LQYNVLGRTGLRVSVAGLGCGGNAQLGVGYGKSELEALALVRAALEVGINFFDTSEAYVTEPILGKALHGRSRDRVVLCTKSRYRDRAGNLHTADTIVANLEASLRRLATDHVEVFLLHGLLPQHYSYALEELAPALVRAKEQGKICHLGVSEFPSHDPDHTMLNRALNDSIWEVIMLGFHMMHQRGSVSVLPRASAQGVGTVVMYAVRNIFSRPGVLQETIRLLADKGEVPTALASDNPLGFLIHDGGASSLIDAAYRFARYQRGVDVVLFGTSSQPHLHANVGSLLKPSLPQADLDKLHSLFGHLSGVGLDLPDVMRQGSERKVDANIG
jgi:aryl-alcohol dehydrogenase-like predicted oxidoreductase